MIEYITVGIVLTLAFAGWLALCIDTRESLKEGLLMAIGVPAMSVGVVAIFIYIIYSFGVVIERFS